MANCVVYVCAPPWNSSPSPKTDFRARILDNYAYSHESGHVWKIAGFLVIELWCFWDMGQSWNMWHPTAIVAQAIRQRIPRMFFLCNALCVQSQISSPEIVLRSGEDADVKSYLPDQAANEWIGSQDRLTHVQLLCTWNPSPGRSSKTLI